MRNLVPVGCSRDAFATHHALNKKSKEEIVSLTKMEWDSNRVVLHMTRGLYQEIRVLETREDVKYLLNKEGTWFYCNKTALLKHGYGRSSTRRRKACVII